jgi:hypothetical protein
MQHRKVTALKAFGAHSCALDNARTHRKAADTDQRRIAVDVALG